MLFKMCVLSKLGYVRDVPARNLLLFRSFAVDLHMLLPRLRSSLI